MSGSRPPRLIFQTSLIRTTDLIDLTADYFHEKGTTTALGAPFCFVIGSS